jgi:HAMP domain-containing protein
MKLAQKAAVCKSTLTIEDASSASIAVFLQKLNSILLIRARRQSQNSIASAPWYVVAAGYFTFLVLTVVIFLGRTIVQPISLLKSSTERIAAGDFSHRIDYRTSDEFASLPSSVNSLTHRLWQKEKLASYVSDQVMTEITASSEQGLAPGGEITEVCVVFCSLADFKEAYRTAINPEKMTRILSSLIDATDRIASKHHGVLDKLIEDTVMLVFRSSAHDNLHVISACKAALELSQAFPNPDCQLHIKIGIASGPAVSGKLVRHTESLTTR